VLASGATFVARGFSSQPKQLAEMIRLGMEHEGFAFIQAMSPCVTFYDTYKLYKEKVYQIPADHDVTNMEAAMRYALDGERMPLGILYHVPPHSHNSSSLAPASFDTEAYMARYSA
jgi:2-oxoglutarate/2-oxoacid ferredoxin oxidoreductase subunit beta